MCTLVCHCAALSNRVSFVIHNSRQFIFIMKVVESGVFVFFFFFRPSFQIKEPMVNIPTITDVPGGLMA